LLYQFWEATTICREWRGTRSLRNTALECIFKKSWLLGICERCLPEKMKRLSLKKTLLRCEINVHLSSALRVGMKTLYTIQYVWSNFNLHSLISNLCADFTKRPRALAENNYVRTQRTIWAPQALGKVAPGNLPENRTTMESSYAAKKFFGRLRAENVQHSSQSH